MSSDTETHLDVRGAGGEMHLVRDLLDKQLVDRNHDPMGRADEIILRVPEESPPRVLCIESGLTALARRLGRVPARWIGAASRRWGLRHGKPLRIPWSRIIRIGIETELDLEADQTAALVWEHWLLEHVVRYLPSIKPENKEKHLKHQSREPTPAAGHAPAPQALLGGKRIRLHRLLNKKVLDSRGQAAGRIEELRATAREGQCFVEEYHLGREALLERLSVHDFSLAAVSLLGAHHGAAGRRVPWQQMDLTEAGHPRLRCTLKELDGSNSD